MAFKNLFSKEAMKERKKSINISELVAMKAPTTSGRGSRRGGVLRIINSDKNGHRLEFGAELKEELKYDDKVQIALASDGVVIGVDLPNNKEYFSIRQIANRDVIYAKQVIRLIIKTYDLDFSNRVSMTFYDYDYIELDGKTVVKVYMIDEESYTSEENEGSVTACEGAEMKPTGEEKKPEEEGREPENEEAVEATEQEEYKE